MGSHQISENDMIFALYLNTIKFKHISSNHNNQAPVFGNFRCLSVIERNRRRFHPDDSRDSQPNGENIIHLENLQYKSDLQVVLMGFDLNNEKASKLIAQMKIRQDKVRALLKKGRSLEEIKGAFEENEGRLIETIYNEIKETSR